MAINSRISIGHDSLSRHLFATDFFAKNPCLANLAADVENCRKDYQAETKKQGCSCRVSPDIVKPCVDKVVAALMAAKENNSECVADFIRYISKQDNFERVRRTAVMLILGSERYDIHLPEE